MTAFWPNLDHCTLADAQSVYEPAEDTYLLADALDSDAEVIRAALAAGAGVTLEVGSGSGAVTATLAALARARPTTPVRHLCTDVNSKAAALTTRTLAANGAAGSADVVLCDLAGPLLKRLRRTVDVLVFNPPYVPTPADEVDDGTGTLNAAWAGGPRGRVVVDRFLPMVGELLADGGVFYLVVVEENDPDEIAAVLRETAGLVTTTALAKRAKNEGLSILRVQREGR